MTTKAIPLFDNLALSANSTSRHWVSWPGGSFLLKNGGIDGTGGVASQWQAVVDGMGDFAANSELITINHDNAPALWPSAGGGVTGETTGPYNVPEGNLVWAFYTGDGQSMTANNWMIIPL